MSNITPEAQTQAAHHLTEMVGSAIGVSLLAADDYKGTQAILIKSIQDFPADMRDLISPQQKTDLLRENTKQVRWHARELHRILGSIDHGETPADDLTAPEDAPQAPENTDG